MLGKLKQKKDTSQNKFNFANSDDVDFLKTIMPHSLVAKSMYYKVGDKYVTVLLADKFPSYIDELLYAGLFNNLNAVVTYDIVPKTRTQAVGEISDSLKELRSREAITTDVGESLNDAYEFSDLQELHATLTRSNEALVSTTLRIYVYANSVKELETKVKEMKETLMVHGIETFIPENEMLSEFRALTSPADSVGTPMPVYGTLAKQYPFFYQSHVDPRGMVYGTTPSGGQVILDTFVADNKRKSYDFLYVGQKGAGKSTALKASMQDVLSLGHMVLAIDVEGELKGLAQKAGGRVIRPTDAMGMTNPLELREMFSKKYDDELAEVSADDEMASTKANYVAEFSRVEKFFYQYIPSLTDTDADELKTMLQVTYAKFQINENTRLKEKKPTDFPVLADLLQTVRSSLYSVWEKRGNEVHTEYHQFLSESRRDRLERLESYLSPIAEGVYASLFNGHSTVNVDEESFVVFDISVLAEMSDRVYNAQLFNILTYIWGEIYKNRQLNENSTDENRRYCVAVIDEAHKILNTRNEHGLDFVEKLARRSRKYYAGLWFASQSPRDFVPDGESEHLDKIKNIFAMVQYKALMQQDDSNIELLSALFPQFTPSEIASTVYYIKGEMLLSLGAGEKIRCRRYVPEEDIAYFGGGL